MYNALDELTVTIKLSEPWNMGELLGWKALQGKVIKTEERDKHVEAAIIQLNEPFAYEGVSCEYFVASPRYEGVFLDSLLTKKKVICALTRIPPEQVESLAPFDLSWWRGGVALIANVETTGI